VLNYLFPEPPMLYQGLFLMSNFILIFVEVSVVVFMSHGYVVSGREAIHRTVIITGLITIVYSTIQGILLFGLGVPLYETTNQDAALYWFITSSLFVIVYSTILILPKTSLKDKMPARPSFYNYVAFLFLLNLLKGLGNLLVFASLNAGFCLVGLSSVSYFALYAPLLYVCFLRDFFREVALPDYFMEMRKSGFYDTDT